MSKVDMSPPQTYSRLFRPWDNTKLTNNNKNSEIIVQNENIQMSDLNISNINIVNDNYEDIMQSKLNINGLNYSSALTISPFTLQNAIMDPLGLSTTLATASEYYFGNLNGLSALSSSPLTSTTMIHSKPSSPNGLPSATATTTTTTTAILDPLAMSFMEHEYVRVMAEDAHLKALNARKQRPKKFKCPHCNVAFSNNGQLKGHIRIHTGERPFKCDLESCGKTFTRNEELTRHKRIHTGLRPYGCSNCGKKFGRRDHLKKHMKTHMPQERHLGPAIYVPMYPYLYGY